MNNELELRISTNVEQANAKLDKLINTLNNGTKATNNLTKSASNISKAFNFTSIYIVARKFFNLFLDGIDSINKYTETLNMFHLVMGDLTEQADKFQNTMANAFGNDTQKQLEYQSYFQTLTESMGLQEKYAYIISENMTKMTYDISSLFDKSQDDVASALRSGLVGQTKPVRNFGMDITENSLQPILDNLGIDRTVRELSQVEKEIVRYLALLQQSSIAHGDMANTIESPSNQLRVFKNQLIECQRWFSALFINTFAKAMPYINAVVMVIKEICVWLGTLFGIEISDYNSGVASSYVDDMEDYGDAVDDATSKVKELKRQTLGFDQINNINENNNNSSGTNVSGGIDQRLLDAIKGYDNGMKEIEMKANRIRDRIMEWLGFTKEIDETTGKVSWRLKDGYTNIEKIRDALIGVAGLWGISKIIKFAGAIAGVISTIGNLGIAISSLFTGTSSLKLIGTGFESLSGILAGVNVKFSGLASSLGMSTGALITTAGLILALVGCLIYAYNESDTFREKVNLLGENIKNTFVQIFNVVSNVSMQIWEVISPIWNIISDTIVSLVSYAYSNVKLNFSNILDIINGAVEFISLLFEGDFKGAFESASNTVNNLKNNWITYFEEIGKNFQDWIKNTINNTKEFVNKVNEKLEGIITYVKELPNKFFYWFGKAVGTAYEVITETNWLQLGKNILDSIINGISSFANKIETWGNNLFKKVKTTIANINWIEIGANILKGITKGMTDKISTINSWGDSFLKGVQEALDINSPSKLMIPVGAYVTLGIKEGMEDEIPSVQKTALKMVDTLQTTFDKSMYDLSLESAIMPNLNQNISNVSTYKTDVSLDYNMLEQASYNGFARAIQRYGLVKIDVKQDKGSIVETAIEGINDITKQTGENPIDLW